ncbi:MAG: hypothetical protein RJA70_3698 [Pseudomonadota bacterium]|jgi:ATP-dependent Clp protease ATP-binding subunit ClpC
MTVVTRREPELVLLRKQAEEWALNRRERVTSAHLLAAIADLPGVASDLLRERGLSAEALLKAARTSTDDDADPIRGAVQRAREVATSLRASEPGALHLLVALLGARRCAGYRVLDQFGVDVARLRVTATNAGLEGLGRRRVVARTEESNEREERGARGAQAPHAAMQQAPRTNRAVTVSLTPKPVPITRRPTSDPRAEELPEAPGLQPEVALAVAALEQKDTEQKDPGAFKNTRRKRSSKHARFVLDARNFKLLNSIGRNLTLAAANGELQPVVGRDAEVDQVLDVLAKREGHNPCLVGVSGVGKTSIVHGVAQRIARGAESSLDERVIVEVFTSELLAGTGVRGSLAQRVSDLKKEVQAAEGRVVLFFDEAHQLFSADAGEELAAELKRALGASELPCIGATTPADFQRCFEADPTLLRRFSRLDIEEPDRLRALEILESLAPGFERHHQVRFTAEALQHAVDWSARYITGRALPDKAIALIDLAGARARRRGASEVRSDEIAELVSETAQVPVERLLESDGERLLNLERTLATRVVGHSAHLQRMARIIRRNAAGLGANRPIGTFLLLGPTGVGKTESAKAIAAVLFGSEQAMTRLDLSEYSEAHAVARLIGAPPGYVGHEAGGQLTEAVRRRPYQVLLFDEIEKAHTDVLETFLPLFDEGRLTDGRGRTVDFTKTVIILTSNIGAREAIESGARRLGFGPREGVQVAQAGTSERVIAVAREQLSPEFFNRLDEVLVFGGLARAEVEEIARRLLQQLTDTVYAQRGVELRIEPCVVNLLLTEGGFDSALGARPMKRAIARHVEAPLAEALLSERVRSGDFVVLSASGAEVAIRVEAARTVAAE